MHLAGFTIEMYQDARSYECQIYKLKLNIYNLTAENLKTP